jgi:outer membrane protein TolC
MIRHPARIVVLTLLAACGCRSAAPLQENARFAASLGDRRRTAALPKAHDETVSTPMISAAATEPVPPDGLSFVPVNVIPTPLYEETFDLDAVLATAGANNPTIALAAEAVRAASALQLQARALALPNLNAGFSYDLHSGNLLSAQGFVLDVERQSLFLGAGSFAVGAGPVTIPGVNLSADLSEAIFEPRIARQYVTARRFDSAAVQNVTLLAVADRYLDLAGAEARLAATRRSQIELGELVRVTANFVKAGQGRKGDADRARGEAELLVAQADQAEEDAAVASARLAELLGTDPATRLHTAPELPLVQLIDDSADLESLVATGLANRPELGARDAEIAAAITRVRQQRLRPMAPLVVVDFSAGGFGGDNTAVGPLGRRTDFDVMAVWRLQNFGVGNRAHTNRARAELGEAVAVRQQVVDQVRREVAEAQALIQARRREVESARKEVSTAEAAFRSDLERSRNLVEHARPIEVTDSARSLNAARQDLIRALVEYDKAQLRLFVALGNPL